MILLKPNILNDVALTLSEQVTLAEPTFLFVLKSVQAKTIHTFIAVDGSEYKGRYNLFKIRVKSDPDRLNGEIDLILNDEYHYEVREQESTTNLDPKLSGKIVEVGILLYKENKTVRENYEPTTKTRAVYKG